MLSDDIAEETEAEARWEERGMSDFDDLVADVTEWHIETFGPYTPWKALAAKLREEAGELADVMEQWEGMCGEVAEESADVQMILCAIAGRNDIDQIAETRKKLEIVKGRDQLARDRERGIPV
jgi:NTP pyrophosphatase (non-canonical NTP hydrolase)